MNKTAQGGRYGQGIPTSDLESIYEWTYKLQMLNQEEKLGDYGVPQILPDRAYIEKAKIEPLLDQKLDEVQEVMTQVYDDWLTGHEPQIDEFYDQAGEYFREKRWEVEHSGGHIGDMGDLLGEENVKGTIVEYLQDMMEEDEDIGDLEEDPYDAWIKYLDSIKAKKAQQRQFEFMDEEEVEPKGLPKPLSEMTLEEIAELPIYQEHEGDILDKIEDESYYDRALTQEAQQLLEYAAEEEYDTPYSDVRQMREAMNEWDGLNASDKIILFQEALTTMHNNGEMAEYLLDDADAVEILNQLSAGPDVEEWDYALSRLLGYPLGSRFQSQTPEWFVPAALKRITAVIAMLTAPHELPGISAVKRMSFVIAGLESLLNPE